LVGFRALNIDLLHAAAIARPLLSKVTDTISESTDQTSDNEEKLSRAAPWTENAPLPSTDRQSPRSQLTPSLPATEHSRCKPWDTSKWHASLYNRLTRCCQLPFEGALHD
jgi:hypothetical protein